MTKQPHEEQPAIAAAVIVKGDRVLLVRRRMKEGVLSWQFPAGAVEPGETAEEAAVRETAEEVGIVVTPAQVLGERIHPATGRKMIYVTCSPVSGDAEVVDTDEIAELAWSAHEQLGEYVPYGLYEPVQDYLDKALHAA